MQVGSWFVHRPNRANRGAAFAEVTSGLLTVWRAGIVGHSSDLIGALSVRPCARAVAPGDLIVLLALQFIAFDPTRE